MKKRILTIVAIILLLWLAFNKLVSSINMTAEFLARQDSLVHAVDSLNNVIVKNDSVITELYHIDDSLQGVVNNQKTKVVKIIEYVDSSKGVIETYNDAQLVDFLNQRYPQDTTTNPTAVAQPVLTSAAKDLVELDGAKQIIMIKDSSIAILEARVANKDSVISIFEKKEDAYKGIVSNQQAQIQDWKREYNKVKLKSKLFKLGSAAVAGVLGLLLLLK